MEQLILQSAKKPSQAELSGELLFPDMERIRPVCSSRTSDSAHPELSGRWDVRPLPDG